MKGITKKEVREFLKTREMYKKAKAEFDRLAEALKEKMLTLDIHSIQVDGVEVALIEGTRFKPVEEVLKEKFPEVYKLSLSPDIKKIKALDKARVISIEKLLEEGGVYKEVYHQLRVK